MQGEISPNSHFIRPKSFNGYTVIKNAFLNDSRLSWKAKGLFCYLLSLPNDWKLYLTELKNHSTDGMSVIRSSITELESFGYIKKLQLKDINGRFGGYEYTIIESPESEDSPYSDFPHTEKPFTEKPFTENQTLVNKQDTNKQNTNKHKQCGKTPPLFKTNPKINQIKTIRAMASSFSENKEVLDCLGKFLDFRIKRGLTPEQFKIILEDLKNYSVSESDMINKIKTAIAGGFNLIIPSWEKNKKVDNIRVKPKTITTEQKLELLKSLENEEKF